MFITVHREKSRVSHLTGGGYAATNCQIYVDRALPLSEQREIVLHEILEAYLPCLPHNKVEELTALLVDGMGKVSAVERPTKGEYA